MRSVLVASAMFAWLTLAAVALAANGPRFATVFEDAAGAPSEAGAAEAELQRRLLALEWTLVDERQARTARSVTDVGRVIGGEVSPALTALDADRVLVGRVTVGKVESALLPTQAMLYEAGIDARVVAVDTGRLLCALLGRGRAVGASPLVAGDAARAAAADLVQQLVDPHGACREQAAPPFVEVRVTGLDMTSGEALVALLGGLSGVREVVVRQMLPGMAELELRTAGTGGRELAAALQDARLPGLTVLGYSDRVVRAHREGASDQRAAASVPPLAPGCDDGGVLVVSEVGPVELLPARYAQYEADGLALLRVGATARAPLSDVTVAALLPGFSEALPPSVIGSVRRGETFDVPLRLRLDPARLAAVERETGAVLRIRVTGATPHGPVCLEREASVRVLARHTISWDVPESAAAFVTHRSTAVAALADAARKALPPESAADPLATSVAIVTVLSTRGIRYAADAAVPAGGARDVLLAPDDLLRRGLGDCEDLAVLVAATAEAAGVRSLLLVEPGHVRVALDTGLPPQGFGVVEPSPGRLLEHDGSLWVPLEPTRLEGGFLAAWEAGAAAGPGGEPAAPKRVDVRRAWTSFPPLEGGAPAAEIPPEERAALGTRVEDAVRRVQGDRADRLATAIRDAEAAAATSPPQAAAFLRLGVLLALAGRVDDAARAFETGGRAGEVGAAENDLGILAVRRGALDEADAHFVRARRTVRRDPRAPLNAALVAWLRGDEQAFAQRIFDCLDRGGKALVAQLIEHGIGASDGPRGAEGGASVPWALALAACDAWQTREHAAPPACAAVGRRSRATGRASGGPPAAAVEAFLYWL